MVLDIILGVVSLVAIFISYYFHVKGLLNDAASGVIDDVEQPGFTGEEKFKMACEQLKALIPMAMKPFISDKLIEMIVQGTFDSIESFAKKQTDKKE